MIPLVLETAAEAEHAFVARLRTTRADAFRADAVLVDGDEGSSLFSGPEGLFEVPLPAAGLEGDVVLVDPRRRRVERLIRADSRHNTLLVTERCDQLCLMCSQPPKKTHVDRFDLLEAACLLAPEGMLLGVSGGEPTLYKERLLGMIERVLAARPDLGFHVLTNAQHFSAADVARLASPAMRGVSWGVPLYAADPDLHDHIVGKPGAFGLLEDSLAQLAMAGARVELRTVLLTDNLDAVPALARYVCARLRFVEAWSLMQLEHIGFAKGRWNSLFCDHRDRFQSIAEALDLALLNGVRAQLFNFPRCTVPPAYRRLAVASISDWKRKYAPACGACGERDLCSGFFEWHPEEEAALVVQPL